MSNSNQPRSNSTWEKIVAIVLATVVLGTFIFYVFNPPPTADATLALIRFLAAFLFVGDLNLEGTMPGLDNKLKVKAAGGFAVFLLVFILFFYGISPSEDSNLPNSQPVTLWGSYPTLALFDPDQPTVPEILAKELNIETTPIIFRQSPVFESIQKFIIETGNQDFIANINNSEDQEFSQEIYSFNYQNKTKSFIETNPINQSKEAFELDSLVQDSDDGTIGVKYNPIILEFSTDVAEAEWTAAKFSENTLVQTIIQYPQLKDIGESNLRYEDFGFSRSKSNIWIKNVVDANPELRGLVGYEYQYLTNLSDLPNGCGIPILTIFQDLFMPYVKFIDLVNYNQEPLQLKSITYKIANPEANSYQLTEATQRSTLFKSASPKIETINVTLAPGRHYIIPIEFGFEFSKERQLETSKLSQQVIYIAKFLPENIQGELDISDPPSIDDSPAKIVNYNKIITQEIKLSNDFLAKLKSSKNEISIPHRLAIGSVISVESLIIDNRKRFIPKPADEFSSSIGKSIGIGSCPYLLVYNLSKGYWIDLGTVLYSRDSKNLQDTEIHNLGIQTTKIRLEERENEITYLDYIAILYTEYKSGIAREIKPNISPLTEIDGKYLALNKGENIEIDVRNLIPTDATDIKLKINGYYTRI